MAANAALVFSVFRHYYSSLLNWIFISQNKPDYNSSILIFNASYISCLNGRKDAASFFIKLHGFLLCGQKMFNRFCKPGIFKPVRE